MRRFRRVMRWMALVSIAAAALAAWAVTRGDQEFKIHVLIATALGSGLSVLLGAALMTLVFISNSSGHDEEAHRHRESPPTEDD
jgi:hypothetical protein